MSQICQNSFTKQYFLREIKFKKSRMLNNIKRKDQTEYEKSRFIRRFPSL